MHVSALKNEKEVFFIPGRIRLNVTEIKGDKNKALLIEKFAARIKGIEKVKVNSMTGRALLIYDVNELNRKQVEFILLKAVKYAKNQKNKNIEEPLEQVYKKNIKNFYVAVTALFLVLLKRSLHGKSTWADSLLLLSLSSALTVSAGYPLFRKGLHKATKEGKLINYPLIIGSTSLVLGVLRESIPGLMVVSLAYLSELLQTRTVIKCRKQIREMSKEYELKTFAVVDNKEQEIGYDELQSGMLLSVRHGEVIPVDGIIEQGKGLFYEGMLTGNSSLVPRKEGDKVFAGSIVDDGHVYVRVELVGSSTALAGLAGYNTPLNHSITKSLDKAGKNLADTALFLAALSFLRTGNWGKSLAILLMGNPGNLYLARSIPLYRALRQTSQEGILVKSPDLLEKSSEISKICFDKTGTLTHITAKGMDVISLNENYSKDEILALVAGVEKNLDHPLARLLVRKAKQERIPIKSLKGEVVPGYGVRGFLHGKKILLGSKGFLENEGVEINENGRILALKYKHLGYGVLYTAYGDELIGLVGIQEVINPGVKGSIDRLKAEGINDMVLLTGDREEPAAVIAHKLGIDKYHAKLGPEEKMKIIKGYQAEGHNVAMIGDGANDCGALKQADMSFVLEGKKNPGGVAASGIVLPSADISKIPDFFELNKKTRLIAEQNMLFVKGLNTLGLALASTDKLTPFKASLLQNLGTIGIYLNSARLQKKKQAGISTREIKRALKEVSATAAPQYWEKDWYNIPEERVLQLLKTNDCKGLQSSARKKLLKKYGVNTIERDAKTPWWKYFLKQFDDYMVKLLLATTAISLFFGRKANVLATLAILVVNTVVGVIQELKAERDTKSLNSLTSEETKIIRNGIVKKATVKTLVPGDIILVEAGDKIPADARLLESENLMLDESILTGENSTVIKKASIIDGKRNLAERSNMIFAGTFVLKGKGKAVVTATGFNTEVGKIADQLAGLTEQEIPIKKRMDELGRMITKACMWVGILIAAAGVLKGNSLLDMFMTAITLIVAAIPEGLSVIVLIAMALGIRRMVKKKVVVRKLPALETLGATTVVCCDKTGTLTKNELAAETVYISHNNYDFADLQKRSQLRNEAEILLKLGMLCNSIKDNDDNTKKKLIGDPTDAAFLQAGKKLGLKREEILKDLPQLKEIPFDSESKTMTVICKDTKQRLNIVKGAPEIILEKCKYIYNNGQITSLKAVDLHKLNSVLDDMTKKALRVISVAYGYNEDCLIFVGMVGLRDQLRPEVKPAVKRCQEAGVKVVMITGDHPQTAYATASELGIYKLGDIILTGEKLDSLSDESLDKIINKVTVFARTAPVQKLRIVQSFQRTGQIVAMTGDGVNDAPAIKAADIGIAMGESGTDVARDAASLVLLDDNFTTIVGAMEEGRNVYFNIKKSVRYLVSTNAGEVVLMALATLLGNPLPLTPIQLLWLNFLGDGLPAIALVSQEPGKGLMKKAPRDPQESIFARGLGKKVFRRGLIMGIGALGAFWWGKLRGGLSKGRTLALASLVLSQIWHLFDSHKGLEEGVKQRNNNGLLVGAGLLSFLMFVASVYFQPLRNVFQLTAINNLEWLTLAVISMIVSLSDKIIA